MPDATFLCGGGAFGLRPSVHQCSQPRMRTAHLRMAGIHSQGCSPRVSPPSTQTTSPRNPKRRTPLLLAHPTKDCGNRLARFAARTCDLRMDRRPCLLCTTDTRRLTNLEALPTDRAAESSCWDEMYGCCHFLSVYCKQRERYFVLSTVARDLKQ